MGNMSYCRFRNTLKDLQDCYDNWEAPERSGADYTDDNETNARHKILELCKRIVADYEEV